MSLGFRRPLLFLSSRYYKKGIGFDGVRALSKKSFRGEIKILSSLF
jgi:hypothetical protein